MRQIPAPLAARIALGVTTLAKCVRVQRTDGLVVAYTDHDQDIEVDGIRYRTLGGFTASAEISRADFSVDNAEIAAALLDESFQEEDFLAGDFDRASFHLFLVDWEMPEAGIIRLRRGTLGEVKLFSGRRFTAELRGLMQPIQVQEGPVFSKTCRAKWGTQPGETQWWCGVDVATYTQSGEVTFIDADDPTHYWDQSKAGGSDHYFTYGVVTWQTGDNAGDSIEVRKQTTGDFWLFAAPRHPIQPGDTYTITAGCDKLESTCRARFDNTINFKGEPFVPGETVTRRFATQ